ncbi:MAG: sigma-70 family RNA polymerase sigma factor [Rikenellaceae bacterium]|nr:sigma-70 family RNA polymerase sigma factor [Rikenellaceae bacterium]
MATDGQILDSFQQGKLELFYQEVYPRLLLYAKKMLDADQKFYAEDCVQNAIYKVWTRQDSLHTALTSLMSLKIYLYMSIRNEIFNIRRKQSHHNRYLSEQEDPVIFRNAIIENEARAAVFEVIKTLPGKEREIIVMSFL